MSLSRLRMTMRWSGICPALLWPGGRLHSWRPISNNSLGPNVIRALRLAALLGFWLLAGLAVALAETADDLAKLSEQAQQLFAAGKYAEALAAQRTVAAGTEKLETGHAR